ncbi:MAG TPA: hypothetical protein VHO02_01735 [Fibrobacteria bacterium]|jgi:hypothetical protein|nr:hypothetical protein [Fibrobacteria bacterium]
MHALKSFATAAAVALCAALAPEASAKTLLLLPVAGDSSVDAQTLAAVNRLFREAVESRRAEVLSVSGAASACGDRDCALSAAKAAGADEVLYSNYYRLGSRWLFSAGIVRADGSRPFTQRLSVLSVEDMEAVTVRMAEAVTSRSTTEDVASLDNLTEYEEKDNQLKRRRSTYSTALSLGYLFPYGNSFNYLKADDNNPSSNFSETQYDFIPRFTWTNMWEFRNGMALGLDVVWGVPHVFGGDLNVFYLMGRGDFSTFVGGGTGFHALRGDDGSGSSDKRNAGPALNAQAGVLLFRTYRVNVLARAEYLEVFTTDRERGLAVDVGLVFHGGK